MEIGINNTQVGNFPAVQWLGLGTFTAEAPGSIPGWGTKIPRAMERAREGERERERGREGERERGRGRETERERGRKEREREEEREEGREGGREEENTSHCDSMFL